MGCMMSLSKPNHPRHRLTLKYIDQPFHCNGCKETGLGLGYVCKRKSCGFYLHEGCEHPDPSAYHSFLPDCSFRFHENSPQVGERYCYACGKDIQGYVYQCTHRKPHNLHPQCLKLSRFLTDQSRNVTVQLKKKLPTKCFHCNSMKINTKIGGWCYVTSCGRYCIHIACAKELFLRCWRIRHLGRSDDEENNNRLLLEIVAPSHRAVVAQRKDGSNSAVMEFWNIALAVFKLVVSAWFGDPTTTALTIGEIFHTN